MNTQTPTREHFTARITVVETPSIVDELQRRAIVAGRSVSDEVRAALRLYLAPDFRQKETRTR